MPTCFQALDMKTTQFNQKQINILALRLIFHNFSPFNHCLSVILQLDKGDYPENQHFMFCPNKQHSFEPSVCFALDKIHPDVCVLFAAVCLTCCPACFQDQLIFSLTGDADCQQLFYINPFNGDITFASTQAAITRTSYTVTGFSFLLFLLGFWVFFVVVLGCVSVCLVVSK